MSRAMKKVQLDGEAIRKWAKENDMSLKDVGQRIGRSDTYMWNIVKAEEIREPIYRLLLGVFGLPDGTFIKKKQEPKPEKKDEKEIPGYELSLQVKPDRLKIKMSYQGQPMYEAWSWIKGNSELDLVQAVSYAAHMLYKQAEQKVLGGEKA